MRYYLFASVVAIVWFIGAWQGGVADAYPHSDDPQITRWVDQMSGWLPFDSLNVEIKVGPCPAVPQAGGCYDGDEGIIWIAPSNFDKDSVGHELGHVFDRNLMNDGMRNKITNRVFRLIGTTWYPQKGADALKNCPGTDTCPNEMFADGFSACARHIDAVYSQREGAWDSVGNYQLVWTRFREKHLCDLIVKIGASYES